jgi:hypothetical protein
LGSAVALQPPLCGGGRDGGELGGCDDEFIQEHAAEELGSHVIIHEMGEEEEQVSTRVM